MATGTDQVVGVGLIAISLSLSPTTLPGASLTIHQQPACHPQGFPDLSLCHCHPTRCWPPAPPDYGGVRHLCDAE